MKKYIVRWVTEGFNERETFNTKREAKKYYNKIIETMEEYLVEIDMWYE